MSARPPPRSPLAREIVGRAALLERFDALLDVAATDGRVIALAGDAGLGKTRLVTALLVKARERRRLVLLGRASPLEAALPLGVFQDALREERRTGTAASSIGDPLAARFPGLLLPELGASGSGVDRGVMFEAAARYLGACAAPGGLVLILEDLHWADPTSHALVALLARALRDSPVLMALTYRPGEAESSSLDDLRHQLARERLGEEVRLEPLTTGEIAVMLRGIVGLHLGDEVVSTVARASGGNPFVIEELVRDALTEGRLDPAVPRWNLEEPVALPGTVQEMLLRRARALPEREREVLDWASVLGERFDTWLLAAVCGLTEHETLRVLGRLRMSGLVADGDDASGARMSFRHALTRAAVLGELLGPERRRRHARVLEMVEAPSQETPKAPLEEMLEHALGAGDRERSLEYSVQAGTRAVDLGGYAEARAQYERALALWRPGDALATKAGLLMRLGYLTSHVGGGLQMWVEQGQSRQHFDEALALYEELGDPTSAALALAGSAWSRGRTDVLDDLLRAREQLGPGAAPDAVCQILCRLGDLEFLVGHPRAARRTTAEGLALLETQPGDGDPSHFPRRGQLRRSFQLTSAAATWWLGDDASGRASMLALADAARRENDHLWAAFAYQYLCRLSMDRPQDVVLYAQRGMDLTGEHGLSGIVAWLAHLQAQAHVHQGDWDTAAALLDRADALLAEAPDQPFLRLALGMVRGELALGRGRPAGAVEILELIAPEVDELCGRIFKRVVRVALARSLLVEGDASAAHAALTPLIDRWERGEEGPFALSALLPMAAAEVATGLGDADVAARWSAELAALGSGARADYGRALADLSGGRAARPPGIEVAARTVEDGGRRWEGAWMRVAGADAAARAGETAEAADLAAAALHRFRELEADGWCRRCEAMLRGHGRRVPGHRTARGPGGLTLRELEVLTLVVEGLSNRAIGERLVISPGTAGRHVSNVFVKLGAHSRLEAARIAAERGLLQGADAP